MGNWLKEIWYGQSKSRNDMGKFASPDGYDYERVVEEMGKTQRELLELAARGGSIFIKDIDPQDEDNEEVSSKVFIDVSGETVLESCVTSTVDVIITIQSTFPMCKIGDTIFELDASDSGFYSKSVNYTLGLTDESVTVSMVLPDDTLGGSHTTTLEIVAGPTILALNFTGGYPGSQTELKAGDTFQISGTTNVACIAARILDYGACEAVTQTFPSTNSFVITGTIKTTGYTTQALAAKVQARNAAGAYGQVRQTDQDGGSIDGYNKVYCNDTAPTFIDNGYTNDSNPTASAFKGTEAGTQDTTIEAYDLVVYSSPHGDFIIDDDTTFEKEKSITCINPGDYNDSETNFRITATRAANAATSIFNKVIEVADTAPLLTVTQTTERLRSEAEHVITVTSNQNLATTPDLNIVVGGTWQGAGFVADPVGQTKIWKRSLLIEHNDSRGTAAWTQVTPAKNNADYNATIIGNCVIGGFEPIEVVFDHSPEWNLEPISNLAAVSDTSKLVCYDNSDHEITYQSSKTDNPYKFTITDAGGNLDPAGNYIYWCDSSAVGANATGTAYLTIEETV